MLQAESSRMGMPAHGPGHDSRCQVHKERGSFVQAVEHQTVPQCRDAESNWSSTQPKDSLHEPGCQVHKQLLCVCSLHEISSPYFEQY